MPAYTFKPDGQGGFFEGIPARDLTAKQFDALTEPQQAIVRGDSLSEERRARHLYEEIVPEEAASVPAPDPPKPLRGRGHDATTPADAPADAEHQGA